MTKSRLWNRLGFRGKVVFAMSAIVIPILFVMASYSYNYSKNLYELKMEEELSLENELVVQEIYTFLNSKSEITKQLGELEDVRELLESSVERETVKKSPIYQQVNQFMTRVQEDNEDVGLVWMAFLEENFLIADHGYVTDEAYDIPKRPWTAKANAAEGLSYSDLYIDYSTKKLTVSVIYPVESEDKRLGYFGLDLHLDSIPALIGPYETKYNKYILLTESGQILYDADSLWNDFENFDLTLDEMELVKTTEGNYYVEMRELDNTGLRMFSYAPEKTVTQPFADFGKSIGLSWIIAAIMILISLSWLLRYMLKDIPNIVKHVRQMEQGNLVTKMGIKRQDEIGEIAQSIEQMGELLNAQVKEIDYQARFDSLTNLPNRFSIERELSSWIEESKESNQMITVAFIDLDHFKQINDSKGHAYGDELLVQVTQRIKELLPENSSFGRFGGDEFIVLIRAKREKFPAVRATLTALHECFSKVFYLNDHPFFVTPSIGVSLYPTDAKSCEQLLINADTALYKAKAAGRNRILFFNYEMKEAFEKQHMMEQGLREAIKHNHFNLVYQPQFNLKTGRTESLEALLRWRHPEWGMISPAEFIPVAEESGYIKEIGDWVLETAIREIKSIHQEYVHISAVAINVSALQLREAYFVHRLKTLLKKYQVNPGLIEIEITESIFIEGGEEVLETLKEIRGMGISIALDDFGTGYSSLNYLRILPINRVKIDRSFVQKMENDTRVQAIIKSVIDLSHNLGFNIVAEGVETQKQLLLLKSMNADVIQGFYGSKPLNWTQLHEFLKEPQTL
ncbi:EAL domain-containing protein [Paenisporosarcina quisquiliarum]|uniref:EAL domain-containing protein n=1 Tax=Paenisporosarcina quisquiliarum TaxID=365346 RepID=A0A9X3LGL8_9BACL|nr:EAL domain-containing protein [Paenisporosarcina quisquiliarum]MCZ8536616.1 EAL domain-containing protein [Paenisporosarcina quisquiliarum]